MGGRSVCARVAAGERGGGGREVAGSERPNVLVRSAAEKAKPQVFPHSPVPGQPHAPRWPCFPAQSADAGLTGWAEHSTLLAAD